MAHAQIFPGSTGTIPDDGTTVYFTCPVSGLAPAELDTSHGLLSVCVDISHTYDSDLDVQLIAPDGTIVVLFSGIGGGGHNFTSTCLTDTANDPVSQGSSPFTGVFRPMDFLGNMNNNSIGNGDWTLKILDTYPFADQGTVNSWSLYFGPGATAPFTVDSSNLPLILIDTYGQTVPNEPKIPVHLKIISNGPGQMNHPNDIPNVYNGSAGIELHGATSAYYPQHPYGFETRDTLGNNLNVSLLGMPAENDWILLSMYNDKVFMRNSLAFLLSQKLGHYAPRTRFCEVILNHSYQGIYVLTEKIKRDQNRVNIHKLDSTSNTGNALTGGYILKVDIPGASDSWLSGFHPIDHPELDVHYLYEYPDYLTISPQQEVYIQGFLNALETALYSSDFTNPVTGYRAYIDVNSLIDYMLVNEVSRNNDGFKKSIFLNKDRTATSPYLYSGPVWDFDWAWKNINECSIFSATDGSGWAYKVNDCNPDNNSPGWVVRLLQDPWFANQLNCRYFEMRNSFLDTAYLFHYIDSIGGLVQAAQERHYLKWPILGINVGTPEVDPQPLTYQGEIDKFRNWIVTRLTWLDNNMPGSCITGLADDKSRFPFLRLFPSPASDHIYIESGKPVKHLLCYDPAGKCLMDLDCQANSSFIDHPEDNVLLLHLNELKPGVYGLVLVFPDQTSISRVFIKI
ncbi:MAG: CotH kinase family protein [Bacteroidetes bacterium]|nr:CotH kinase family protein [Bacteroidota bacterium]